MRTKKVLILMQIIIFALLCTSCQKTEDESPPSLSESTTQTSSIAPVDTSTTAGQTVPSTESSLIATTAYVTTVLETTVTSSSKTTTSTTVTAPTTITNETTMTLETTQPPIQPEPLGELSSSVELKLREDFAVYMSKKWSGITADDVYIAYYYGTYNGFEVVVMYGIDYGMNEMMQEIPISEYIITLPSGDLEILVHIDSSFLNINEAYAEGYLSDRDIYEIQFYANM